MFGNVIFMWIVRTRYQPLSPTQIELNEKAFRRYWLY